jgi:hypothetical protein
MCGDTYRFVHIRQSDKCFATTGPRTALPSETCSHACVWHGLAGIHRTRDHSPAMHWTIWASNRQKHQRSAYLPRVFTVPTQCCSRHHSRQRSPAAVTVTVARVAASDPIKVKRTGAVVFGRHWATVLEKEQRSHRRPRLERYRPWVRDKSDNSAASSLPEVEMAKAAQEAAMAHLRQRRYGGRYWDLARAFHAHTRTTLNCHISLAHPAPYMA